MAKTKHFSPIVVYPASPKDHAFLRELLTRLDVPHGGFDKQAVEDYGLLLMMKRTDIRRKASHKEVVSLLSRK